MHIPRIFSIHIQDCLKRDVSIRTVVPLPFFLLLKPEADYISTNIISITDGQLVLSRKSFEKGLKPAINYGLSVSRLGGAVQDKEMKKLGAVVRRKFLSYLETKEVYQLANVDEMSPEMQQSLKEGEQLQERLLQYKFSPRSADEIMRDFKEVVGKEL